MRFGCGRRGKGKLTPFCETLEQGSGEIACEYERETHASERVFQPFDYFIFFRIATID